VSGEPARVLVVDDTPHNLMLLADVLELEGYAVATATRGGEALEEIEKECPDLVLLDVLMPDMTGYDVCKRIRENPTTRMLPVVLVTALDATAERVRGIEVGANDFLTKPINKAEILARVRSLLQIKELHEKVASQAAQLQDWNRQLEERVKSQVEQLNRLEGLKRFFSPQIADLLSGERSDLLEPHRRKVVPVFLDLRGFTSFAETAEPEEVVGVLREYHVEMGKHISAFEGTLERFAGDGIMIFFNDPVEIPQPEVQAVRMALKMRESFLPLQKQWSQLGFELGLGIGISSGHATLGLVGYEGRQDYSAIGTVTNQAARLCDQANDGQILVSERVLAGTGDEFDSTPRGAMDLKGFTRPVNVHQVLSARTAA
jgi:class 3 adenylate cyclase